MQGGDRKITLSEILNFEDAPKLTASLACPTPNGSYISENATEKIGALLLDEVNDDIFNKLMKRKIVLLLLAIHQSLTVCFLYHISTLYYVV